MGPRASEEASRTELQVRRAGASDRDAWNRFLGEAPGGNHYQRFEWMELNQRCLGHVPMGLMAEEGGRALGILPLSRVRSRLFGDLLVSMPFVNFGGPLPATGAVAERLLQEARSISLSEGCDYLEIRSFHAHGGFMHSDRKVSMTIPLQESEDAIWNSFSRKHRKNVRRAEKNEVDVSVGGAEMIAPFYRVMERSWRSLGTPLYRKSYFENLFDAMPDSHWIFLGKHQGKPVAATLVGRFGPVLEGMWAAQDPAWGNLQANYVMYWEMIRWACAQGFEKFHLGRSTRGSGAADFKARWNAVPEPLYWNVALGTREEMPELNPDNPRFRLAMAAWRRLPLPILRVIGPWIAPSLP